MGVFGWHHGDGMGGQMIILRRLATGVWDHAGVRFTEWLGAAPLLGVGYALYAQPETLMISPSFSKLAQWADAAIWSNLLMLCGTIRLAALFVNGTFQGFRYSPEIRFFASCCAAMFWTWFTIGIFTAWRNTGGSPTGVVAYGTLIFLELRNVYVSRVDMARGGRNAGIDG